MTLKLRPIDTIERRALALADAELKIAAAGTFSGYGAVFGNRDSHGDVIERGAFRETIREWQDRGKWPKMLLQHGGGPFGGGAEDMLPIGQWMHMEENARGLKVEGRLLAIETDFGQRVYAAMKAGELDSLSIGFKVRESRSGTKPTEPARTLTNIDLWEVSIVTFPSNPKALLTDVKSLTPEKLRDLEDRLRDAGLSRRDSGTAVSVFKALLLRDAGVPENTPRDEVVPDSEAAELLESLSHLTDRTWTEVFRS